MELSAEDIETLRSAERALYNRPGLQDLIKSMADRLSPPEPEQPDEATVWTRKVLHAEYQITAYATGEMDDRAPFIAARQVLSELIASKDAEIAEWKLAADEARSHWDSAVHEWNKADSELAALRAENERLKDTIADLGVDLDEWQRCERAAGNIPSPKAAERNTAEPALDGETSVFPPSSREGACALADRVETSATDTTPEVVESWAIKTMTAKDYTDDVTEAEARGRQEALEKTDDEWREIIRKVFAAAKICPAHYSYNPLAAIRELKRLMTERR